MDVAAILAGVNVVGLAAFGFLVKGLKERIDNLTALAKEQKETLEAVRTRATELDQLRKDYRQGLDDFQALGKKIDERRAELVTELELAIKSKDEQLARTKQRELESLDRIPELEKLLSETIGELQKQIKIVAATSPELTRSQVGIGSRTLADIIRGSANEWAIGNGTWAVGNSPPQVEHYVPRGMTRLLALWDATQDEGKDANNVDEIKSPPKEV